MMKKVIHIIRAVFILPLLFLAPAHADAETSVKPEICAGLNIGFMGGESGDGMVGFPSGTAFLDIYLYPFSDGALEDLGIAWGIGYVYAETCPSDFGWTGYYSDDTMYSNNFMPMYASFKFNFGEKTKSSRPFVRADIGGVWWWPDERLIAPGKVNAYDWGWWTGFYTSLAAGMDIDEHLTLGVKYSDIPCYFNVEYKYMGSRYTNEYEVDFTFFTVYVGYRF